MKFIFRFLLLFSAINFQICMGTKYNISMGSMDNCKVYYISEDSNGDYTDFFNISNLENNNVTTNESLHLKFYVLSPRDAHILLTENSLSYNSGRLYDIALGASANTHSDLCLANRACVSSAWDFDLLSNFEPTPIEIVQSKGNGKVEVYIPGYKETPLLNYTDPAPFVINYISFGSTPRTPAKWFYDCPFDDFATKINKDCEPSTPKNPIPANKTKEIIATNKMKKNITTELPLNKKACDEAIPTKGTFDILNDLEYLPLSKLFHLQQLDLEIHN